ncbi:MAG: sensor histidine kinase [Candidatus Ornithomonoglobus sp.]
MSKKTIAEKHSLIISDYTNQTLHYVNKQMEKAQEVVDLLMFDDVFKYTLRQDYDSFEAYDIMINQIVPKCQNVLKIYDDSMSVMLYVNNHTLNERYYKDRKSGVSIFYSDRLKNDEILAQMRSEGQYVLWTQTEQDKKDDLISIYARLINFGTMREDGILIFNVEISSLFANKDNESSEHIFFEIHGSDFIVGNAPPDVEKSINYRVEKTPLSPKGFELVSYISEDYYKPQIWENIKSILIVFLISSPFIFVLGLIFRRSLYRDVNLILTGIQKVQRGEENTLPDGKFAEFRQISDVLNEYIKSVEQLVQDVYEIEIQKQDIEFSMLQAKINPHFLYNIFTVIKELANAGFDESIVRVVDKTAAFYRQILSKETGDYTLREEFECVRTYMEIFDIIKQKDIILKYEADSEILDAYMPRFLLQPIIENSIKHAMAGTPLLIKISAWCDDEKLVIQVADNGVGMTEEQLENCMRYKESRGYGIYNIINRLRLKYPEPEFGLKLFSREGEGTTAVFTLPYTTEYPEDDMYE